MTAYTKTTNFAAKDSLTIGDPNKIIKGTEHDVEYENIETAVNSKANTSSPTFTGTANFANIASGALTGVTINNSVIGGATPAAGTFSTFTLASGATVTSILDEDTLSSNSATALVTQQSVKAYVDAQVVSANSFSGALAAGNTSGGNNVIISAGDVITTDTINETTAAAGVTVDGVLLKDGLVDGIDVSTVISTTGLTTATVATDDKILIQDTSDTDNVKTVTVQSVVDLAGSGVGLSERTSNTILGSADSGKLVDITSGTFTQTFDAVATLGADWFVYLRNSGTGDITLDPNASEEIDGLTSFIMYPGESRLIQCDGTKLTSVVLNSFYRAFTGSGTFTKPPGYFYFGVDIISAGGGGSATANNAKGGGGGGRFIGQIAADLVSASESVTVGAGGAGSATSTVTAGGNSVFAGLTVYGGGQFQLGTNYAGSGGSINSSRGSVGATFGLSGGWGHNNGPGGSAEYGGGGGQYASNTGVFSGGSSLFGGGGGGGQFSTQYNIGGSGGPNNGGTANSGGVGGAGASSSDILYCGGGGGAGSTTGGAGGVPAGGGGGGVTLGGAGARGEIRLWGIV